MDTCTLCLGTAGWSRNGHQVQFEFALGIRNCDCKRIASNCLFLNLEAILGGGVGERVTSLTEGRVRSRIREAEWESLWLQKERGTSGSNTLFPESVQLLVLVQWEAQSLPSFCH